MEGEGVEPLRITKGLPTSPSKTPTMSRPLAELNPMGIRRNSPSIQDNTSMQKQTANRDSSPFDPSPKGNSPLSFWKNRESNSPGGAAQHRRVSVEALKKASRVNNNIFTRKLEVDENAGAVPSFHKAMNGARPMSTQIHGLRNNFGSLRGHVKAESESRVTFMAQDENRSPSLRSISPSKEQISPQKSSLSRAGRFAIADIASDIPAPKELPSTVHELRRPKSVTFDVAPPQINMYERATPVPSSVASDSREGSYEFDPYDMDDDYPDPDTYQREDSFEDSLEDTEKTPVVLPEDWRHITPDVANTDLANNFEDPFGAGLENEQHAGSLSRSGSVNRPLPPLPPAAQVTSPEQVKLERSQSFQRTLPTPPRAPSISKQDIISMRDASPMPLEERLRLLSVQRSSESLRASSALAEPIVEEAGDDEEEEGATVQPNEKEVEEQKLTTTQEEFRPPSRISRESILRQVRSEAPDSDLVFDAEIEEEDNCEEYADLDPDVPIPSRETSNDFGEPEVPVLIKDEEDYEDEQVGSSELEDDDRSQAISHAMRLAQQLGLDPPSSVDLTRESSVVHHIDVHSARQLPILELPTLSEEEPYQSESKSRDTSNNTATSKLALPDSNISLPDFSSFTSGDDLDLGLMSYLSATPEDHSYIEAQPEKTKYEMATSYVEPSTHGLQLPPTLNTQASFESIAGSVIHHDVEGESDEEVEPVSDIESERSESPEVPEPVATIKATGMKLKTRVSSTPAEIKAMAAQRRLVSGEIVLPSVEDYDEESEEADATVMRSNGELDERLYGLPEGHEVAQKQTVRKPSMKHKLDMPLGGLSNDFSFGLEEDFGRLMEDQKVQSYSKPINHLDNNKQFNTANRFDTQKQFNTANQSTYLNISTSKPYTNLYTKPQRGYLLRENTKVVVASNRNVSEAVGQAPVPSKSTASDSSSAKPVSSRKPSEPWKAEPWNGKMRRQSTRRSNIVPDRPMSAVPPLPGQTSNAAELEAFAEDQLAYPTDDLDDGVERGRLFVKVVQVKDLELPLPRYGRCQFQMTLDNGMHCVTTSMLELGKSSAIGQEFELVVFDDLEFQLTLQTNLPKPPKSPQSTVFSTMSAPKPTSKVSKLKNFLTSPKKRREQEQRQREDEEQAAIQYQQQQDADYRRNNQQLTQWDLQHELIGPDGSFARAYVSLKDHEKQAFGRPYVVDVPCYNEWAVEDKSITSTTRSKLGGMQRRPPYKIAKMELQMMYIPRPRGSKEEDMPRSMSAALRQLKEAETASDIRFEGHLSQQGGDCPYWRRRYFKLEGSKLTAYHETTRQPRVSISLAKAIKLINDRPALTQPDPAAKASKDRRKSAFGEDEEGYMFVEEGFRIRFANGEVIDFYADNTKAKDEWMRVLSQVVGKELTSQKVTWSSAVLARQRAIAAKNGNKAHHLEEEKLPVRSGSVSTVKKASLAASPSKKVERKVEVIEEEPVGYQPSPPAATAEEKMNASKRFSAQPPPKEKGASARGKRQAIKSMIF